MALCNVWQFCVNQNSCKISFSCYMQLLRNLGNVVGVVRYLNWVFYNTPYIKMTGSRERERKKDGGNSSTQLPFLHPAGSHTILPTVPLFHLLTPDLLSASVQADKWISPCEECAQALWINVRRIISLVWQCTLCASTSSCESTNPCGNPIIPLNLLTANHQLEDRVGNITDYPFWEDKF